MSNVISVSRALSKSKSLLVESIVNAKAQRMSYVEVNKKTLDGNSIKDEDAKIAKVYKSVTDKVDEAFRLRKGINEINAKTKIDVGFGELSIQDALAYKLYVIPAKEQILKRLVDDRNVAVREYREAKMAYDTELRNLESKASKDSSDDINLLIEMKKKQEPVVHTMEAEIDKLRAEIEYFESEFDAVMSELNPTLKFEI